MISNFQFIFNDSELGAGTRGSSLGSSAIFELAKSNSSELFLNKTIHYVQNLNKKLDNPSIYSFAKYIDEIHEVFEVTSNDVSKTLLSHKFPLIIAGDHSSAGGTILGIQKANPGKRLGVIWIDAHADLHSPYTSPSGNMHGMPVATALGIDNFESQRNDVDIETANYWGKLKSSVLKPSDLVYVSVRDTEKEEDFLIQNLNLKNFSVQEIRTLGISSAVSAISARLEACDIIYVSFDVDSMDPELSSYGTGTPVLGGLSPEEAKEILSGVLLFPKTIALEVVEVNPSFNKKNKMEEVAFDILEHLLPFLDQK